jgi:hypothetical protein
MKLKIFFTWLLLLVFQLLTTAGEVSLSRAMIVAGNFFKESSLIRCMDASASKSVQLMFYFFKKKATAGHFIIFFH